jgi:hypothetical protein
MSSLTQRTSAATFGEQFDKLTVRAQSSRGGNNYPVEKGSKAYYTSFLSFCSGASCPVTERVEVLPSCTSQFVYFPQWQIVICKNSFLSTKILN